MRAIFLVLRALFSMKIKQLDHSKFCELEFLPARPPHHSHDMSIGTLSSISDSRWYAKKMKDPQQATINLLASELYRLVCQHRQPKALITKTDENEWFYLSEDLGTSYRSAELFPSLNDKLGLADVLLVALWLNEVDLKCDNLLIDYKTFYVAKIDPECSFYSLFSSEYRHEITPRMLECLPKPHCYPTYNWLRYLFQNNFQTKEFRGSGILPSGFIKDKHATLLKLSLLPNVFIEALCKSVLFKSQQDAFCSFLIKRASDIKKSAMFDAAFLSYASSEEARSEARHFLDVLLTFEVQRVRIASTYESQIRDEYRQNQDLLARASSPSTDKENTLISLAASSIFASNVPIESSKALEMKPKTQAFTI